MLWVLGWPPDQTGPRQSRLPIYIYLFAAARPQSSDTEGAPPRPGAWLLLLVSVSLDVGSPVILSAAAEFGRRQRSPHSRKPLLAEGPTSTPRHVRALHTFWVAWLARARASVHTAVAEPTRRQPALSAMFSALCDQPSRRLRQPSPPRHTLAPLCADTRRPFADGSL